MDAVGMTWLVRGAARSALRLRRSPRPTTASCSPTGARIYTLVVGEKMTMPVRVIARGVAGHASRADARRQRAAQARARARAPRGLRARASPLARARRRCSTCWRRATGRWTSGSSAAALSTTSSGTCCPPWRAPRSCRRWRAHRASATSFPPRPSIEYDCRVLPGTERRGAAGRVPHGPGRARRRARAGRAAARRFALALRDAAARRARRVGRGARARARCSCRTSARASRTRTSCGRPSARSPTVSFHCATRPPSSLNTIHAPDERIDVRDLELAVRSFVHCIDRIGSVVA